MAEIGEEKNSSDEGKTLSVDTERSPLPAPHGVIYCRTSPRQVEAILWDGENIKPLEDWGCYPTTPDDEGAIYIGALGDEDIVLKGWWVVKDPDDNLFWPESPGKFERWFTPLGYDPITHAAASGAVVVATESTGDPFADDPHKMSAEEADYPEDVPCDAECSRFHTPQHPCERLSHKGNHKFACDAVVPLPCPVITTRTTIFNEAIEIVGKIDISDKFSSHWQNGFFQARSDAVRDLIITRDSLAVPESTGTAIKAAQKLASEINGGEREDQSYPSALLALLDDPSIANEAAFAQWVATIIEAELALTGWQPIATASKDGELVLIPVDDWVGLGYWDRDPESEGGQCWRWYNDRERIEPLPTLFMRLPDPPIPQLRKSNEQRTQP